jgi:glycosyltransferase involved in cell wall biosynthesis
VKRLNFLVLPPFIKSASDVVGERTIAELRANGVDAQLHLVWSEKWARRLLSKRNRIGHLLYKYVVSPLGVLKLLNKFGPDDLVWTYDLTTYANLKCIILEKNIVNRGGKFIFQLHDDWLALPGHREAALERIAIAALVGGVTKGIVDSIRTYSPEADPHLLRAPIDIDRLQPSNAVAVPSMPKVIWTGNPNNIKEIPGAMDVLASVYKKNRFDFFIISGSVKPGIELPIPWKWLPYDGALEAERISGACAGLAPLEDTLYARGKDVFKVKTYMACGVPPIATALGNNLDVIRDGETGYLVKTAEEWEERLTELVSNPAKARAMGAAARVDCVNRFSHAAIISEWIQTLERHFGDIRKKKKELE